MCARVLPHSFACELSRIYMLFSIFLFMTTVRMRYTRQPHRCILTSCASCDLATVIHYGSLAIDGASTTHIVPSNFRGSTATSRCLPSSSPTQYNVYIPCHEHPRDVTLRLFAQSTNLQTFCFYINVSLFVRRCRHYSVTTYSREGVASLTDCASCLGTHDECTLP